MGIKNGQSMTAPPGLGPPGIWVWDGVDKEADAATSDTKKGDDSTNWPETPSDSEEVEFVGRLAQLCFGSDFVKMTVSCSEQCEGNVTLSNGALQLHLEPNALSGYLPPLARLQAVLTRDAAVHRFQISRMERSKDNGSLFINIFKISASTCWDVLKAGCCPRAKCTWQHPAPVLLSVSCAGDDGHTALPTLMPDPLSIVPSDKITALRKDAEPFQSKDGALASLFSIPPAGAMGQSNMQLNFAAFMDDSSGSSEDL